MKKYARGSIYAVIIVFTIAFVCGVYYLYNALSIGTGYSAKYLCSQVFLSDRDPDYIVTEEINPTNPLFGLVSSNIDRKKKEVTAVGLGFLQDKTAIYRKGFGCTLAIDRTREQLMQQVEGAAPSFKNSEEHLWPTGNMVDLRSLPPGVDREKIEKALDYAFMKENNGLPVRTQAVAVIYRGRLIAERYADNITPQTRLLGWSMTKSITGALVGFLVKDGKLDVAQPAPVEEWQQPDDPRSEITLDNLMRMNSGLAFEEKYAPMKDATDMLYDSANMAAYAAAKPLANEPGEKWSYSSGTTNILMRIVREKTGGSLVDLHRYLQQRLFKPLHMDSAIIEPDASGNFVGSSYMFATARDWARIGQFFLQKGKWEGRQLLPEGWMQYCTTPTPGSEGQYGAQIWLNPGTAENADIKRSYPRLPDSMFYLSGFNLQRVAVFPENDLVIVRLGVTHNREKAFDFGRFAAMVLEGVG
ncbi:MAG: serine hydrolase [Desulfobacterales bacterium]|nr:serine hydrolase [Desulfobacterales bacterium]